MKEIATKALAIEFIKESEYLRTVSCNDISNEDYEKKLNYVNEIRAELHRRNLTYSEIKELAK